MELSYDPLKDKAFEKWLKAFYKDPKNTKLYSEEMIIKIAEQLFSGIEEGYGKLLADVDYDTPDAEMLRALKENVYTFSAYKNHQELLEVNELLLDENGLLRSFAEFQAKATEINVIYNQNYLRTEYDTAVAQAQMASKWEDVQANIDVLPMLTIRTVRDSHVRAAHRVLEGLTLRADHSYWTTHWPPFDWGCRCDIEQNEDKAATPEDKIKYLQDVPAMFKGNVGIDKKAFKDHPYETGIEAKTKTELEKLGEKLYRNE